MVDYASCGRSFYDTPGFSFHDFPVDYFMGPKFETYKKLYQVTKITVTDKYMKKRSRPGPVLTIITINTDAYDRMINFEGIDRSVLEENYLFVNIPNKLY